MYTLYDDIIRMYQYIPVCPWATKDPAELATLGPALKQVGKKNRVYKTKLLKQAQEDQDQEAIASLTKDLEDPLAHDPILPDWHPALQP